MAAQLSGGKGRFMPEDLFGGCAVTVALARTIDETTTATTIAKILNAYGPHYDDDDLRSQLEQAAAVVLEMGTKVLSNPRNMLPMLKHLSHAIKEFEPDGTRRKKRLFGGALFNYKKEPDFDRVAALRKQLPQYWICMASGVIPFPGE